MHPVLQHLMNTDFADLEGSRVEGTFAVSDDLVNLGLHELIAQLVTAPASAPAAAPAPYDSTPTEKTAAPDPKALLRRVDVEKLQYRTEAGRTILEMACAIKK
ncbi:hypothetical protein [Lewinella sp. IMCC34183]|uniref:hypothetical protein n=1 Tax=Lewinella sp. IMCC34183 TaxID=2248762 RepID=UPI000E2335B7|nr:hypothetical protein [Lewinella sp. IMCC34183]